MLLHWVPWVRAPGPGELGSIASVSRTSLVPIRKETGAEANPHTVVVSGTAIPFTVSVADCAMDPVGEIEQLRT